MPSGSRGEVREPKPKHGNRRGQGCLETEGIEGLQLKQGDLFRIRQGLLQRLPSPPEQESERP
jgi:hypothetical protein